MVKRKKIVSPRRSTSRTLRSPRNLGEQKQNYVSAKVVLRPKEREFKVLAGDEWVLSQNVENYIPTTENMGATIKGLKDKGFQISALGAASVSIGGNCGFI